MALRTSNLQNTLKVFNFTKLIHHTVARNLGATTYIWHTHPDTKFRDPSTIKFRKPETLRVKEVVRTQKPDGSIVVEGRFKEEPGVQPVYQKTQKCCPLCDLNIDIHYTDVLILRQFMFKDGTPIPRTTTGLCGRAQKKIMKLIHKAHNAGLLPTLRPPLPKGFTRIPDHLRTYKFAGLNRYFTDKY